MKLNEFGLEFGLEFSRPHHAHHAGLFCALLSVAAAVVLAGCQPETQSPSVTGVVVTADDDVVVKGETLRFYAEVLGNTPPQWITWSIDAEADDTAAISSGIDSTGLLSVGETEARSSLTVRATSQADASTSGAVTVAVLEPNTGAIADVTIDGASEVGDLLKAIAKDSKGVRVTNAEFQWLRASDPIGGYEIIIGATLASYRIDSADNGLFLKVEAKNDATTPAARSSETVPVKAKAEEFPTPIKSITINMDAPAKGVKLGTEGDISDDDERASVGTLKWYTIETGYADLAGTSADPGEQYIVQLVLTASEGYTFTPALTVTVDGSDNTTANIYIEGSTRTFSKGRCLEISADNAAATVYIMFPVVPNEDNVVNVELHGTPSNGRLQTAQAFDADGYKVTGSTSKTLYWRWLRADSADTEKDPGNAIPGATQSAYTPEWSGLYLWAEAILSEGKPEDEDWDSAAVSSPRVLIQ